MDSMVLGSAVTRRRPASVEDEGRASVADMEAGGFPGKKAFLRKAGNGYKMGFSSPWSLLYEEPRHFLDACYLCKKPIGQNKDIFMYRGDIPFCSEGCRQEQIDKDEAMDKNRSLSIRLASSKTSSKAKNHSLLRAGSVVVG